jgi:hypothetical protein
MWPTATEGVKKSPAHVIPSEARNLALLIGRHVPETERDSSLRSLESHVIPAKAGIQLV